MPQSVLEARLEEMAPGLVEVLGRYTAALRLMAKAQVELGEFISDKPEISRRFELIGEIAKTTGQPLTDDEVLDILAGGD